jgi:predicted transcriptional regulator
MGEENKFKNAVPDFMTYDFLDKDISKAIKNIEKSDVCLEEDEEKKFFKQFEIKGESEVFLEPEPVVNPERVNGVYTDDEVTSILNALQEYDLIHKTWLMRMIFSKNWLDIKSNIQLMEIIRMMGKWLNMILPSKVLAE